MSYGSYIITENTIKVTEIPIGESIENYKQFLEKIEADDRIITFKNNSSDTKVSFEIKIKKETLTQWEYEGLYKYLTIHANTCFSQSDCGPNKISDEVRITENILRN